MYSSITTNQCRWRMLYHSYFLDKVLLIFWRGKSDYCTLHTIPNISEIDFEGNFRLGFGFWKLWLLLIKSELMRFSFLAEAKKTDALGSPSTLLFPAKEKLVLEWKTRFIALDNEICLDNCSCLLFWYFIGSVLTSVVYNITLVYMHLFLCCRAKKCSSFSVLDFLTAVPAKNVGSYAVTFVLK